MNPGRIPRMRHARGGAPATSSSRPASTTPGTTAVASPSFIASTDTQTLALPSGRTLAYASYGPLSGFPILYFHGFPSSRLEGHPVAHLAFKHHVRLIAPDRPGYGQSSPQPGRRIPDWPADVHALAAHLGLARYGVLGGSGGGPYALACAHPAYGLPRDQMVRVGVLAGAPPWEAGTKDIMWSAWCTYLLATYTPGVLRVLASAVLAGARRLVEMPRVKGWIEGWLDTIRKKKNEEKAKKAAEGGIEEDEEEESSEARELRKAEEALTPAQRRERLFRLLFEPFAQGPAAAVQETRLLTQPWGIKFEELDCKIVVWHGAKDVNSPISMMRWMAAKMPQCDLREFESDSHFSILDRLDEVLEGMKAENKAE